MGELVEAAGAYAAPEVAVSATNVSRRATAVAAAGGAMRLVRHGNSFKVLQTWT